VSDMYRAYLNSTLLADDATMDIDAARARFPEAQTLQQWVVKDGVSAVEAACRKMLASDAGG
jgi:hypothetical protein